MKPKVAVLMPTFKASSFLKNQLFSIISQNDVDVHLFIFNDGCDIKTDKIINDILRKGFNIEIFKSRKNFGNASKSYFFLLKEFNKIPNNFDYLAFADHDDIWGENKLTESIKELTANKADCFSSSVSSFDYSSKGFTNYNFIRKNDSQRKYDYFFQGPGPGCTFVLKIDFIKEFCKFHKNKWRLLDEIFWHDWYMYIFARTNGKKWHISSNSHILYIQRGQNETGSNMGVSALIKRLEWIKSCWYIKQSLKMLSVVDDKNHLSGFLYDNKEKITLMKNFLNYRRSNIQSIFFFFYILYFKLTIKK